MDKRKQFDQFIAELRLTYEQLDDPAEPERIWKELGYAPTDEVDEDDEDLKHEIMGYLTLPKYIVAQCCETCKKHSTVFLQVYYDEFITGTVKARPRWVVRCRSDEFDCDSLEEAKFCPHCGAAVPEIEPSGIKKNISSCVDGGYYCDTCEERLHACTCLPPEFHWKVKGT